MGGWRALSVPGGAPPARTLSATFLMGAPVVAGLAATAVVEALGAASLLGSRTAWWVAGVVGGAGVTATLGLLHRFLEREPETRIPRPAPAVTAVAGTILAVTLLTALVSPPNNYDALVYHDARVMEWWDHGNLGIFPTSIDRQLRMPPFASYLRLALWGATGSDLLFNAVQWLFFAWAVFGVALLAESLAPGRRAGELAALLAATMPMAVLQASSSQNDLVCGGYVVAEAWFLLRVLRHAGSGIDLALLGGATGLALLTKGTAIPFALPLLAAGISVALVRMARLPALRKTYGLGLLAALALAVLPISPYLWRLTGWSGLPGSRFPEAVQASAYLDEGIGPGAARVVSQLSRNGFLQLGQLRLAGIRSAALADGVAALHRALGIGTDDPRTSFPGAKFAEARWQLLNHEDTAPSTLPFLLALVAPALLLAPTFARTGLRGRLGAALAAGWLLWGAICLTVAFMPWNQRLQLPALLLLTAPAAAVWCAFPRLAGPIVLLAVVGSLPCLFLNHSRPLVGLPPASPEPVWRRIWSGGRPEGVRSIVMARRWDGYFRTAEGYRGGIEGSLAALATVCPDGAVIGLRVHPNFPEYLLWAGARHVGRDLRFRHLVGDGAATAVCAVVLGQPGSVTVLEERGPRGP